MRDEEIAVAVDMKRKRGIFTYSREYIGLTPLAERLTASNA